MKTLTFSVSLREGELHVLADPTTGMGRIVFPNSEYCDLRETDMVILQAQLTALMEDLRFSKQSMVRR